MLPTQPRQHKARRRVKFPGIASHAEVLGVTRQHLFYVLDGSRHSPQLAARYRALLAAESSVTKPKRATK